MKEITLKEFEEQKGLALVKFFSKACGQCKTQEKLLEPIVGNYPNITFTKLDIACCPTVVQKYDICTLPTILLFKDGTVVGELVGLKPRVLVEKALNELV